MADKDYIKMLKERDKEKPMHQHWFHSLADDCEKFYNACPTCDEFISRDYKFCPNCGQRIDTDNYEL